MGKYSDIRRGKELNEALTKLRAWEDLSRAAKQTLYKGQRGTSVRVNANRVSGYVESFGLAGRIYLPVKLLSASQSTNAPLISTVRGAADDTGRTLASNFTLPTGGTKLDGMTGYKPAKISLTQRGAEVTTKNKSRITDVEYKRYDNKSVASPFGSKNTGGETYLDAVAAIRAQTAIATFLSDKGNRISFTPEVV